MYGPLLMETAFICLTLHRVLEPHLDDFLISSAFFFPLRTV